MGYFDRPLAPRRADHNTYNHTPVKPGKLSLITKSNLVRVTVEEINAIRPSAYKYLLP